MTCCLPENPGAEVDKLLALDVICSSIFIQEMIKRTTVNENFLADFSSLKNFSVFMTSYACG